MIRKLEIDAKKRAHEEIKKRELIEALEDERENLRQRDWKEEARLLDGKFNEADWEQ